MQPFFEKIVFTHKIYEKNRIFQGLYFIYNFNAFFFGQNIFVTKKGGENN